MNASSDDGGGARPDPAPLMRLATSYWDSQTFLTANRIGLFDVLSSGPMDATRIAAALDTRPRPTRLFLNACVGLGLLERDGTTYSNAPASRTFMTRDSKAYLGNAIRYSDDLYATWGDLEKALREDEPQMQAETYLGKDEERTRHFVHGMHNRALGVGTALTAMVDLAGCRRMLDIGGGPGTYACLFALKYPDLHAQVLDLPEITAYAEEIIASMGVGDRVRTLPGDYHGSDFPTGNDAVLISGVFHRETESACRSLIARAYDSLEPGGLLVVSDVFTDSGGASPPFAALFGLNMMLTAPNGGVHADADIVQWFERAEFGNVESRPFPQPMPHRVITGRKT